LKKPKKIEKPIVKDKKNVLEFAYFAKPTGDGGLQNKIQMNVGFYLSPCFLIPETR